MSTNYIINTNINTRQSNKNMNQQISNKVDSMKTNIRVRHRQQIMNEIRKQYTYTNYIKNTSINKRQHEQGSDDDNQQKYYHAQIQQYPLISRTLQKFQNVPHHKLGYNLKQISLHLLETNMYLSIFQQQSIQEYGNHNNHDHAEQHLYEIGQDEQSLLVHDLFYLVIQHPQFQFPRKFKFIHNASHKVATFIALVSTNTMPQQLAYWIEYMDDQDKQLVYINIIADYQEQQQQDDYMEYEQQQKKNRKNKHKYTYNNHLYYQTWINHPHLRHTLLCDLPYIESAAKAVRQIVGYKQVHPDRLKNEKGITLTQIMQKIFNQQLESMVQTKNKKNTLFVQHLQISIKIIYAKLIQNPDYVLDLFVLLNKILRNKIEGQKQIISNLFVIWVVDAYFSNQNKNNHNYEQINNKCSHVRVLDDISYRILIQMVEYDRVKYIGRSRTSGKVNQYLWESFVKCIKNQQTQQHYKQCFRQNPVHESI